MVKYIVSACLAGEACRYDGKSNECAVVRSLVAQGRAVPVCPEVLGGLPIPRIPCELQRAVQGGYAPLQVRVITAQGHDATEAFVRGASMALEQARQSGCTAAIVKSRSPSCGALSVYDGSFTKKLVAGQGIWAHMLTQAGFYLYSEENLPEEL